MGSSRHTQKLMSWRNFAQWSLQTWENVWANMWALWEENLCLDLSMLSNFVKVTIDALQNTELVWILSFIVGGKKPTGLKCELCGALNAIIRCEQCMGHNFCGNCDIMYHRHPKRLHHARKVCDTLTMSLEYQIFKLSQPVEFESDKPPLPPKGENLAAPPKPPPRRSKSRLMAASPLPSPNLSQRNGATGTSESQVRRCTIS